MFVVEFATFCSKLGAPNGPKGNVSIWTYAICPYMSIFHDMSTRDGVELCKHYILLSDICGRVGRNADNFDAVQRARPFENPVE